MNKKISIEIAVGIIILIALAFGGYVWFQGKKVEAPTQTRIIQSSTKKQDQPTINNKIESENIYQNNEFGFQATFPQSWSDDFKAEKEEISKEESLSNNLGEIILSFKFPLDNSISEQEDSATQIIDEWLWKIRIIPAANWRTDLCGSKPLCIQGKILGRNSQYVFESIGHANVYGAETICAEQLEKQPNFCKALNDFDENKINFKLKADQLQNYVNPKYGFQLTLPAGWENYKVVNFDKDFAKDGLASVHFAFFTGQKDWAFGITDQDGKLIPGGEKYADLFAISIWSKNKWDKDINSKECKNDPNPGCPIESQVAAKTDKYVFTFVQGNGIPPVDWEEKLENIFSGSFEGSGPIAKQKLNFQVTNQ